MVNLLQDLCLTEEIRSICGGVNLVKAFFIFECYFSFPIVCETSSSILRIP